MKLETFKKIIQKLEMLRERSSKLYDLGIDILNYEEPYHEFFTIMLKEIFGEEGYDWISWYLYERVGFDGRVLQAWDENENEICNNIESLWEEINKLKNDNR
jgi:hypothetical protein